MSETVTSYVVDFGGPGTDEQAGPAVPVHKVYADPANPAVGQGYAVRWVSPFDITITSPYSAAIGQGPVTLGPQTEEIALGGNITVGAEYPIATLSEVVAITPVVDIDGRTVSPAGQVLTGSFKAANGALIASRELWGSVRVTYTAPPGREVRYAGQGIAGEYVYIATAPELTEPEHVTVAVGTVDGAGGAAESAYQITTDPGNPTVGQAFAVVVRAADSWTMSSPYGQPLVATTDAAETVTAVLALGGSDRLGGAQPIASFSAAVAVTPLVAADGAISAPAGADVTARLTVVDGQLLPDVQLWGSVRVTYRGFPPQRFASPGFGTAGQYLFTGQPPTGDPVFHAVDVAAVEPQYSWSVTPDGTARLVNLYVKPWVNSLTLAHSGGIHATFAYQGVVFETVEEDIEIVDGAGQAGKPVVSVTATEWRYEDLGAVAVTADGAVSTNFPGNSILHLTYRTKAHRWRGTADVEQVQVYLEA